MLIIDCIAQLMCGKQWLSDYASKLVFRKWLPESSCWPWVFSCLSWIVFLFIVSNFSEKYLLNVKNVNLLKMDEVRSGRGFPFSQQSLGTFSPVIFFLVFFCTLPWWAECVCWNLTVFGDHRSRCWLTIQMFSRRQLTHNWVEFLTKLTRAML